MLQRAMHMMQEVGKRTKGMSDHTATLNSGVTDEAVPCVHFNTEKYQNLKEDAKNTVRSAVRHFHCRA